KADRRGDRLLSVRQRERMAPRRARDGERIAAARHRGAAAERPTKRPVLEVAARREGVVAVVAPLLEGLGRGARAAIHEVRDVAEERCLRRGDRAGPDAEREYRRGEPPTSVQGGTSVFRLMT